jgi:hypothetical protein
MYFTIPTITEVNIDGWGFRREYWVGKMLPALAKAVEHKDVTEEPAEILNTRVSDAEYVVPTGSASASVASSAGALRRADGRSGGCSVLPMSERRRWALSLSLM